MNHSEITSFLREVFGPYLVDWRWHPSRKNMLLVLLRREAKWEERKRVIDFLYDEAQKQQFRESYNEMFVTEHELQHTHDAWLREAFQQAA